MSAPSEKAAEAQPEKPSKLGALDPQTRRDLEVLGLGGGGEKARGSNAPRPQGKMRRWAILGGIALVLLLAGIVKRLMRPAAVELVAVAQREVGLPPVVLTAAGYLVARRQITVSSKSQGKLVEMAVDENDTVHKGDLIGRIENEEQGAQLRLAEAELAKAESDYRRSGELGRRGIVSAADVEARGTSFEVAKARRDLASLQYENTFIRAPIEGTVVKKLRDVGEFLTIGVSAAGDPGTAVVTLADLSAMEVELEISETEISKVRPEGVALVTPEALPDRRYLADVTEIAAMADRQKSIVPVKLRLRKPDSALKPDMTVKVSFLESEPQGEIRLAPVIPATAVREEGGSATVFVVEKGKAQARTVKLGGGGEDYREVESGLSEGEFIVKAPPEGIESGSRVQVGGK